MPTREGSAPGTLRALLRSGTGIAVAMAVQNISTYGFTIIAARRLGPAEYSAVASLMGLLLVVVVLSLGLQATGARKIAAAPGPARRRSRPALMSATYRSALALGALCLLLTPVITWGLQLEAWPAALMIGLAAVPLTIIGGQSGVLQGEQRWGALGGIYLGVGLGRLAIASVTMLLRPDGLRRDARGRDRGLGAGARRRPRPRARGPRRRRPPGGRSGAASRSCARSPATRTPCSRSSRSPTPTSWWPASCSTTTSPVSTPAG